MQQKFGQRRDIAEVEAQGREQSSSDSCKTQQEVEEFEQNQEAVEYYSLFLMKPDNCFRKNLCWMIKHQRFD